MIFIFSIILMILANISGTYILLQIEVGPLCAPYRLRLVYWSTIIIEVFIMMTALIILASKQF